MLPKYERNQDVIQDKIWLQRWLNLTNYLHWHDEVEIIYCEDGKLNVTVENTKYDLSKGESVFVFSEQIHKIESEDKSRSITIQVDKNLVKNITSIKRLKSNKLQNIYDIEGVYKKVKNELNNKDLFYFEIIKNEIKNLLINIFRTETLVDKEQVDKSEYKQLELLKEISKEIELNHEFISFNDICTKFGYSPSYMSRMFVSLTGITITKYINAVKVEHAVNLIEKGDENITEVANSCGFSSIRNFNRVFKELTGYSPSNLPHNYNYSNNYVKIYNDGYYNPTREDSIMLD